MAQQDAHNTTHIHRILAHPLRAQILDRLSGSAVSPTELAAEMPGVSLALMSYHVRVLVEAGMLELVGTRPRRGALQHFYTAREPGTLAVTASVSDTAVGPLMRELRETVERAERSAPGEVAVTLVVHRATGVTVA